MRVRRSVPGTALLALGLLMLLNACNRGAAERLPDIQLHPAFWITAYYPSWQYDRLKPQAIDYSALTHLVHFAAVPHPDVTLDFDRNLTQDRSLEVVAAAHKAGKPVLLCIGGEDSGPNFVPAIAPDRRDTFITNLIAAVKQRGYDGLDIDMEPVRPADADNYTAFIRALRAAMQRENPHWLLTAATADQPALFAALQDQFDQINLMTYSLSGPWEGWVSWYNSPLHSGSFTFPGTTRPLPSAELMVQEWLKAGIKPQKLGMGLAFYGVAWHGIKDPNVGVMGVTSEEISYQDVMKYYRPDRYHWQADAQVPYLSVEAPDPKDTLFISYDDEQSLRLKVGYALKTKLGGLIIWDLGDGFRSDVPPDKGDALLQAVKSAAFSHQ